MTQGPIAVSTTPPLPGLDMVQQVNTALATLGTDFAGDDDPAAYAQPFMKWADTQNGRLKIRNSAGSAWVDLGPLLEEQGPPVDGALFASQDWVLAQGFGQAATESAPGTVSLATTAEVLAGTNTQKAVTPAALLAGLLGAGTLSSTNGYLIIPVRSPISGARENIIVQGGVTGNVADAATAAVTFPIQFPSACLLVLATNRNNSAGGNFGGCTATTPTTSGCSVGHNNGGGNSSPIAWLAIGK